MEDQLIQEDNIMEKESVNRDKWLHVRLTEDELKQVKGNCAGTVNRKFSEYARKVLLGKPHVGIYRNASLDESMADLMKLRKDLNGLANNFNQAVHKLHTLNHLAEFRKWLALYELEKKTLLNKVDEIRVKMNQIADLWLQ